MYKNNYVMFVKCECYALSRMSRYLTTSTGLPNNLNPQYIFRVAIIRKPIDKQIRNIASTGVEGMVEKQSIDSRIARISNII